MRRLIPLCLLLSACASQYPPAGGGYVAPSAAPTASLPFDAIATRDAAQLQVDAASRATQAVIDTTQNAQNAVDTQRAGEQQATQWVIDHQLTQYQVTRDALALSMTLEAHAAGATLTALYLEGQQGKATGTAQAMAHELVVRIDEQNKARAFAGMSNTLWGMFYGLGIVFLFGLPSFAVFQWIQRKRWAPYALPGGVEMIDARAAPALPEPTQPKGDTLLGLQFLDAALCYHEENIDFPARQIPSDERLRQAGFRGFGYGRSWQYARDLFGSLLVSDDRGTFCRDGDVQWLREQLASGKITLPYPIKAVPTVPGRS